MAFTVLMVCWGHVSGISAILMLSLDFHVGGGKVFISNDSQSTGPVFADEQTLAHLLPDWKACFCLGLLFLLLTPAVGCNVRQEVHE